ncbi:MAG: hypothetical protein ACPGN8_06705 [Candidatus Thalassarchaeaceae archaeon]
MTWGSGLLGTMYLQCIEMGFWTLQRVVDAGESNSQASRNILIAVDALLRADRIDSAIQILETELGRGC